MATTFYLDFYHLVPAFLNLFPRVHLACKFKIPRAQGSAGSAVCHGVLCRSCLHRSLDVFESEHYLEASLFLKDWNKPAGEDRESKGVFYSYTTSRFMQIVPCRRTVIDNFQLTHKTPR